MICQIDAGISNLRIVVGCVVAVRLGMLDSLVRGFELWDFPMAVGRWYVGGWILSIEYRAHERLVLRMEVVKRFRVSLVKDCRVDAFLSGFRCMIGDWMMHGIQGHSLAVEHDNLRWLHVRDLHQAPQVVVVSSHDEPSSLELLVPPDYMLMEHKLEACFSLHPQLTSLLVRCLLISLVDPHCTLDLIQPWFPAFERLGWPHRDGIL